jgi:hypothetical protein
MAGPDSGTAPAGPDSGSTPAAAGPASPAGSGPTPPTAPGDTPAAQSAIGPVASLAPSSLPKPEEPSNLVFYISVGTETSPGKVYQVGEDRQVFGKVNLQYTATGMAVHKSQGLVLAVPRDGGKLMRIDPTGKASILLEKDSALQHPVSVSIASGSDMILAADNFNNTLVALPITAPKPKIYTRFEGQNYTSQDMSVAVTKDKHVIFSSGGAPGVFRFGGGVTFADSKPVLPTSGGVTADVNSFRWAAAQDPNRILVYDGEQLTKKLRLPAGKSLYHNGVMGFGPRGSLCVAVRDSEEDSGEVSLLMFDLAKDEIKTLFPCKEPLQDFVVGPRMPWRARPGAAK